MRRGKQQHVFYTNATKRAIKSRPCVTNFRRLEWTTSKCIVFLSCKKMK